MQEISSFRCVFEVCAYFTCSLSLLSLSHYLMTVCISTYLKFVLQNSSGGGSADFPIAQISSVDLDFDNPINPVYAMPEKGQGLDMSTSSMQGVVATPYSTVPVPLSQDGQQQHQQEQHHYGTGKRPGFATISRARYKPDSDLIRALEAEFNSANPVSDPPDPVAVSQYNQNSGFKRKDLQSFLIHSGEKSEVSNTIDHNVENTTQTSETFVFTDQNSTGHHTLNSELKEKLKNRASIFQLNSPFSTSSQSAQPVAATNGHQLSSQQSGKKNIITNPNAHKKASTLGSRHTKYAVPSVGYFANGRYYDPNPMPCPDSEVYAPGSTYSDHSNAMSTFLGDLPRSGSASSSDHSGVR